jgi:hypothetical protein
MITEHQQFISFSHEYTTSNNMITVSSYPFSLKHQNLNETDPGLRFLVFQPEISV